MRDLRENLIDILKAEVKPAVGCTEPVAVALACAKAKELLGEDVVKNKILVSPNVYKNAMCVGIPGTERLGLKIAVAMGLVGGKSEDGLTLLEGLTDEQVKKSEEYMDATPISIEPLDTKEKVVIDVTLEGENNKSRVIIKTKHDNFVFLQQNNLVLLDEVDDDGFPMIAICRENKDLGGKLLINEITSIYEKTTLEHLLNTTYDKDKKFYTNKKTEQYVKSIGLQLSKGLTYALSDNYNKTAFTKSQVEQDLVKIADDLELSEEADRRFKKHKRDEFEF